MMQQCPTSYQATIIYPISALSCCDIVYRTKSIANLYYAISFVKRNLNKKKIPRIVRK